MSAAERAEARRKAILNRGSDRLKKLTTSARGEDHPAYAENRVSPAQPADDPPLPTLDDTLRDFVGEDAQIPPAQPLGNPFGGDVPYPPGWSQEKQQQFMQALMGAGAPPGMSPPLLDGPAAPTDDPMQTLLASMGAAGNKDFPTMDVKPPKPPTLVQRLLPLLHLLSMSTLLAYFVFFKEPELYAENRLSFVGDTLGEAGWGRWAELGCRISGGYGVQIVSFFWAFLTLEIALQSTRMFVGLDSIKPPTLLALALPHLPPPIPGIIRQSLRYIQLAGTLMDDLAIIIVGMGLTVAVAGFVTK